MSVFISLLIFAVVTAISLLILSKIEFLGIEVDSIGKALTAGVIFGVLNWIVAFFGFLSNPVVALFTLGISFLIFFLINLFAFGLTAKLVQGFRLNKGLLSLVLGSFGVSIINSIILSLLQKFGISV